MSAEAIRFRDFQAISTGECCRDCFSTKYGRVDHLEFVLMPNPGEISADAIAIALSTLCGSFLDVKAS